MSTFSKPGPPKKLSSALDENFKGMVFHIFLQRFIIIIYLTNIGLKIKTNSSILDNNVLKGILFKVKIIFLNKIGFQD